MADESTILARFATMGAEEFIQSLEKISDFMLKAADAGDVFDAATRRLKDLYAEGAVSAAEYHTSIDKLNESFMNLSTSAKGAAEASKDMQASIEADIIDKSARDWENLASTQRKATDSVKATKVAYDELLASQEKINAELSKSDAGRLAEQTKQLSQAEKERASVLAANQQAMEANNAAMSRQDAITAQLIQRQQELNATALGRFTAGIYGGAEGLELFQKNAYSASRNANLLAQSLATQPIATLTAFKNSAEKAAIAAQFLREQIAFVAASRFGTIMAGFAIFGTIASIIRNAAEATAEMDKAVSFVSSAFVDAADGVASYGQIMKQIEISSIMTGKSFKEVGQAMWELKSAGLSASETFAFMDTNMMLATQNNAKLGETIRLTVGLYRTFGDQITQATTPMEKMAYVGDTLAFVLNKSAADMNDVMQSFKYVASTANLAGVSFEEVSAALVVLHNHMIRGSTAGMSMNAMLLQLAKNWSAVGKQFDIAIDPTKPVRLAEIISKFANSSKVAALSVEQLANVFTTFEIRGGRAWATLIKHPKEFERVYGELTRNLQANSLSDIFEKQMDNLSSQWERFKQLTKTGFVFEGAGEQAKDLLKAINDTVEGLLRMSAAADNTESNFGKWINAVPILGAINQELVLMRENVKNAFEIALNPVKQFGIIGKLIKQMGMDAQQSSADFGEINSQLQEMAQSAEQVQAQLEIGLTSEQMFALEIAKGNVSLQQQVEHMKAVTTEAYNALSAALKQHAAQKDIDKLFTDLLNKVKQQSQLEKQVEAENNKALKTQEKQTKAIEKQQNALSKNAELAFKIKEGFLAMQEATPVREVQQLMLQMEKSLAILKNAVSGTDQWRQGIEGVFTAYGKLKNVQKLIDDSFGRMISATQKLQGIGSGLVDTLMQLGDVGAARGFAESMESAGRDMLSMANSAEQQVSAYDLIISGIKERMKVEGNSKRLLRELANAYQSQWTAQRQVLEATKEQNAQLITMLTKLDAVLERLARIFEKSKLFADSMRNVDVSNLLPEDMDTDMNKLQQAISQVEQQITGISFESKNLIAPEAILNADKLNVSMVNFANTQQNNVAQASQLSNSFTSVNQNASQVLSTITSMTNGMLQVTTITSQIVNGIETWKASTEIVGQNIGAIVNDTYQVGAAIMSVADNMSLISSEVSAWSSEQDALTSSVDGMNMSLINSEQTIYQVKRGMDDILKATMDSDKAFQEVNDSTDDVTKNVIKMSDNFDDSQRAIGAVSRSMERTTVPSTEIEQTTGDVVTNLNDWMSPIDQSYTGLGSVNNMTNSVNSSVEKVLSNLDRMAQKIRSMPKLNVTGGGGGMPTNNDILTNPGYQ